MFVWNGYCRWYISIQSHICNLKALQGLIRWSPTRLPIRGCEHLLDRQIYENPLFEFVESRNCIFSVYNGGLVKDCKVQNCIFIFDRELKAPNNFGLHYNCNME